MIVIAICFCFITTGRRFHTIHYFQLSSTPLTDIINEIIPPSLWWERLSMHTLSSFDVLNRASSHLAQLPSKLQRAIKRSSEQVTAVLIVEPRSYNNTAVTTSVTSKAGTLECAIISSIPTRCTVPSASLKSYGQQC